MRGITVTDGSELRISFKGHLGPNGQPTGETTADVLVRTDTFPYWIAEAIAGAAEARNHGVQIPAAIEARDQETESRLMVLELRASMRAIAGAAFALDAFYASVKGRSPEHPDHERWREKKTARYKQVYETLRYHLKIDNKAAPEVQSRIKQVFKLRDSAVHPGAEFRKPEYRPDTDSGVYPHFSWFRAENALAAVAMTVQLLDALSTRLVKGSEELAAWTPKVRTSMNHVLGQYEQAGLLPIGRAVPPATEPEPTLNRPSTVEQPVDEG